MKPVVRIILAAVALAACLFLWLVETAWPRCTAGK